MQNDSGHTLSAWMGVSIESDGPLTADATADVCIVGAGISGISTAYLLAKEGKRVLVLDDGPIGGGETGRTTAHFVNALDDRYFEIERVHGEGGARLAAESHTDAIERVAEIVAMEGIDCALRRVEGYLFLSPEHGEELLDRELAALHRAGLDEVEKIRRAPLDTFDSGMCLRFPHQVQLHPLKYLAGLSAAIRRMGGKIHTGTHVSDVQGGLSATVTTTSGLKVKADHVVVATNSPVNDRVVIHTKQAPYRTYVIGLAVPRGALPHVLLWDTGDPYHYVRTMGDDAAMEELLIVGGEDHKTGQAHDMEQRWAALEQWTRIRFPMARELRLKWSGQVLEPVDGLAFIGKNPVDQPNVYIATGDSGNGMTHGTIAGILLTDLILGRESPWEKLYDPRRKSLRTLGELAKENVNAGLQYADYVLPPDVISADRIARGAGAVMQRGLKKIAVHRDAAGQLHECSAVCTHLGGVVQWNEAEKTWDCPLHGSRFDPDGKVLNGPAISPLARTDEQEETSPARSTAEPRGRSPKVRQAPPVEAPKKRERPPGDR
jgi:glycine/D-amino acid oxidase-like deaminating enzyme/nitrite reductase/ring-hydroxylating ferredoxin subunit